MHSAGIGHASICPDHCAYVMNNARIKPILWIMGSLLKLEVEGKGGLVGPTAPLATCYLPNAFL